MTSEFGEGGREMPGGREKPLHLQSTSDLWVGIIGFPAFGSFFVAVPLVGTPVSGSWSRLWIVLFLGGFFTLTGVLLGVPRLKELRRRGAWVPPGVTWQPVLVSIVLVLLIMAAGVACIFTGGGVSELAVAAGMRESLAGGLGAAVTLLLAGGAGSGLWRLVRNPPPPEGNGSTEPSPPAERPPE
jgi:hypothetical protein